MQDAIFSEPYSLDKAKRYEIIRTVGRGAFGEILLAWDSHFRPSSNDEFDTDNARSRSNDGWDATIPSTYDQNCHASREGFSVSRKRGRALGNGDEGDGRGFVALKSVACGGGGRGGERTLSKGLFRELRALQRLDCTHVVRLLDVYPEASNVVLVLEYMPSDLAKVLDYSPSALTEADCKAYAAMLLKGLAYIHSHGMLHRDVKPANLLLSARGVLKIADFGQARTHEVPQIRSYSHQVATRWYRAPELLYGTRRYGFGVDLWAAGAIVGEMLASRPLFQGRSDIDQLNKILQVTGTPTEQSWPGVSDLPDYDKEPKLIFQGASKEASSLAMEMMCLDPRRRIPAQAALRHSFFFVSPEPTPCHLLPVISRDYVDERSVSGGGRGGQHPRGSAFLDMKWWPTHF